jgi:ketosteroid isomerase-like protein
MKHTEDFLDNFRAAVASHEPDRVAECFRTDCRFDLPVHPARSFTGRDQARQNWSMIFATVPDLRIDLVDAIHDGDTCWAEWEYSGTRTDGTPHLMRGVTVITVDETGRLRAARFYVDFVDTAGVSITEHLVALKGGTR